MQGLFLFYKILGGALLAMAGWTLWEKYNTVRGGSVCDARILRCIRAPGVSQRGGAGGYCYEVEFTCDGVRYERRTNDSFLFNHSRGVGHFVKIWFNPDAPVVERKNFGTELLAAAVAVLGVALLLFR